MKFKKYIHIQKIPPKNLKYNMKKKKTIRKNNSFRDAALKKKKQTNFGTFPRGGGSWPNPKYKEHFLPLTGSY